MQQNDLKEFSELQLQSRCFLWAYNTFPETRGLLWHVPNEQTPHKVVVDGVEWVETNAEFRKRIAKMKAAGLIPGVHDLHLLWWGVLHVFELKVGKNVKSHAQEDWGSKVAHHGAKLYDVRSEQEFRTQFLSIIKK